MIKINVRADSIQVNMPRFLQNTAYYSVERESLNVINRW